MLPKRQQLRGPGTIELIDLGIQSTLNADKTITSPTLTIVQKHPNAIISKLGPNNSVGYDLYSITVCSIPPNSVNVIDTGIAAKFPPNTYGRIASRSGLALHHKVEAKGGVIDPDYTGNIKIILHNFGSDIFHVKASDRVAQLILEQYLLPHIQLTKKLPPKERNNKGFGSTGIQTQQHPSSTAHTIDYEEHEITQPIVQKTSITDYSLNSVHLDLIFTKPVNTTTIKIRKTGTHPTLGLELHNDDRGPIITHCKRGTPAVKIPKWRQVLKGAVLYILLIILKYTMMLILILKISSYQLPIHIFRSVLYLQNRPTSIRILVCHNLILTNFYTLHLVVNKFSLKKLNITLSMT